MKLLQLELNLILIWKQEIENLKKDAGNFEY